MHCGVRKTGPAGFVRCQVQLVALWVAQTTHCATRGAPSPFYKGPEVEEGVGQCRSSYGLWKALNVDPSKLCIDHLTPDSHKRDLRFDSVDVIEASLVTCSGISGEETRRVLNMSTSGAHFLICLCKQRNPSHPHSRILRIWPFLNINGQK